MGVGAGWKAFDDAVVRASIVGEFANTKAGVDANIWIHQGWAIDRGRERSPVSHDDRVDARGDARGDARTTESMGEFRVRGFVAFSRAEGIIDASRSWTQVRALRGNSIAIDGTTRSL